MGRLNNTRTYLIGAIDNCPNGGENWRAEITPQLQQFGITVYDPTRKSHSINKGKEDKVTREQINRLKACSDWDGVAVLAKPIRQIDLRLVDLSHFIILNLDHSILSCGTHEEWVTANRQKKPVIIRCEQGKAAIPNWMFGAMPHELFFSEWREVMEYLWIVDTTTDESLIHPRWVFI